MLTELRQGLEVKKAMPLIHSVYDLGSVLKLSGSKEAERRILFNILRTLRREVVSCGLLTEEFA